MKGAVGQVILTARRPRADDKSGQQGEKRVKVQFPLVYMGMTIPS